MLIGTGVSLEHFVSSTVSWVRAAIEFDKWLVEQLGLEPARRRRTTRSRRRRRPTSPTTPTRVGRRTQRTRARRVPASRGRRPWPPPPRPVCCRPCAAAASAASATSAGSTASSSTSSRLQNAKRTKGAPCLAVVVEDRVRDGDDAAALGQRAAEGEAVRLAERADVGGDEVRARRAEDLEAGRPRGPSQSRSRLARRSVAERRRSSCRGSAQRLGDRVLERARRDVRQELLRRADRRRPAPGAAVTQPTFQPVNENVLPRRRDGDRALAHPGKRRERDVLGASKTRCSYTSSVTTRRSCSTASSAIGRELGAGEHGAGRVVRGVEQEQPGRGR